MGEGQEVAQGCVNEKQGGVADPGVGPKEAGGTKGLLASQRDQWEAEGHSAQGRS